jgi:hypothetical protein
MNARSDETTKNHVDHDKLVEEDSKHENMKIIDFKRRDFETKRVSKKVRKITSEDVSMILLKRRTKNAQRHRQLSSRRLNLLNTH